MSPTGELTHAQLFPLVLTIWRALLDDAVNPDGIMHLSDNLKLGALAKHVESVGVALVSVGVSRIRFGDPVLTVWRIPGLPFRVVRHRVRGSPPRVSAWMSVWPAHFTLVRLPKLVIISLRCRTE